MSYTNSTLITNFLQRSLNANETAYLATLLPAIDKWIDRVLNSTFASVNATTRYYDGGVRNLDIDPCTVISAVKSLNSDGTTSYDYDLITTPDVVYEPVNETVKREIRKRNGCFPRGVQNIAVTAKFSEYDGAVPEDIQIIATQLAAGVLNQGRNASSGGNVQSESLEGHSITYSTSDDMLEGIGMANPTIAGLLSARREVYVDPAI
jgi:hypothetical protein